MSRKTTAYQGSEVIKTELRMYFQTYIMAFIFALTMQLVVFLLALWLEGKLHQVLQNGLGYAISWFFSTYAPHKLIKVCSLDNQCAFFTMKDALPIYAKQLHILWYTTIRSALGISILSYFVSLPLIFKAFHMKAHALSKERTIRGRDIVPETYLARKLPKPRRLPVSRHLSLPVSYEVRHILVAGKTGTGKTTLISQMLQKLREDGEEKVIVYDFKGDYMQKFYRENIDRLFNPLDRRCIRWTVFNDIETDVDIAAVVESLIPPSRVDQERYWHDGAQAVLSAILKTLRREGNTTNRATWDMISMPGDELMEKITEHRQVTGKALQFLADGRNTQAAGVLSSLMQFAGVFEYLAGLDGDFSFRDWLNHGSGWLFITNTPRAQQLLRPALSMAVDLLSREILSLPDDKDRRIFLFLDEFATLQNLASIIDFITLSRSKGGVAVVGIQDLGRVQKLYGREQAKTIVNNTGNLILFAMEGETAEEFSRVLGEKEVSTLSTNVSFGPDNLRDGMGIHQAEHKKQTVLPSELGMLREFEVYVRFAEGQLTKTRIMKEFIPEEHITPFEYNDTLELHPAETEETESENSGKKVEKNEIFSL